jgi:DNA-binding transcriptional LysR family regulator
MDRFVKYRCLVILAQTGNYSTAAHQLGVSQPALSRSIQALEHSVGSRLVDRSGKRATLTPIGELVYSRAGRILQELGDLEYEIEQQRGAEIGQVSIGAGPYPSVLMIPQLLADIGQRFPRLQVRCETEGWRLLVRRLKERQLDLVVAEASEAEPDLELKVSLLKQHKALLVVRRGHPLAGKQVSREQISQYPFATVTLPGRVLATLQGALGIRWHPALQCDDVRLLMAFVRRSDSITIVTRDLSQADPELVPLSFPEAPVESRIGIIRLATRTPSLVARVMIQTLLANDALSA